MKKWILLTMISVLPLTMMAQDDDMYFVPTKENVAKEVKSWGMPKDTYYSGSNRSVDDYNHYSTADGTDGKANDIIDFSAVRGVYPDSIYADASASNDYQYTKRLSRFDDYSPSEVYWEGYRDGRWSSPWYYSSAYYPWYDVWYDPWYTPYYNWRYHYYGWNWRWYSGWYGGWYRPWGYYGWHRHAVYHHPSGSGRFRSRPTVSSGNRTFHNGERSTYRNGSFSNGSTMNRGSFGNSGTRSGGFSGSRSGGSSFGGNRSSGGGGSFGGGRGGSGSTFSRGR